MKFISTRDPDVTATIDQAIVLGLAPGGGLFVPESFPKFDLPSANLSYPEFSATLLEPFFADSHLQDHLEKFIKNAFNFPVPCKEINTNTQLLELFHGPTLSFKDFGARFLAECLNFLAKDEKKTVMVATSGDTGSAVASAFYEKENINVVVLFPKGKISKRQEQQITCWHKNVTAVAVNGVFDDCQSLVKAAFKDPAWQALHLTTANSINVARLLPQMTYYAYTSQKLFAQTNQPANFIVPSGNFGNVTACYWAKQLGFPIGKIVMASNENHVMSDYLATGEYKSRPSIATLANAMDVGNPSNFERLQYLFPDIELFRENVTAISVDDEQIKMAIKQAYQNDNLMICPHTAVAYCARQQLSDEAWIIVATADPCKFETIIEPLLNVKVPVATQLDWILQQQPECLEIDVNLGALLTNIENHLYKL